MESKTMVLKYYGDMKDEHLYDLLIQANLNNKNKLMVFYDSSRQDCPDTRKSTGSYMIFYQGGNIDHGTHVPGQLF